MAYRYSIPMNLLEIDTLVVGRTLVPENFGTHVVACSSAMIYCCLRCCLFFRGNSLLPKTVLAPSAVLTGGALAVRDVFPWLSRRSI